MSVVLAAIVAVGVALPNVALADSGVDQGTITVKTVSGNDDVTYNVYKIFTCDVDKKSDGSYVATNISWSNETMGTKVTGAIQTYDNTYTGTTAEDAASYLASHMGTTGSGAIVAANGLAENLVKAIDDLAATTTLTANTATTMAEGYYLIISKPDVASNRVGTSPIFTMLGNGQTLEIEEKTSFPTITKTVTEGTAEQSYADAHTGQVLTFTLTGTVGNNIDTFTSYIYMFADTLTAGLTPTLDSDGNPVVEVKIDGSVVDAGSYTATYGTDTGSDTPKLTVSFTDLRVATADGEKLSITADTKVTVTYTATLNSDATAGSAGNANSATLTYSNDPQKTETTGTSVAATAKVYEYLLQFYTYDKVDLEASTSTTTPLSGAKYTIQAGTQYVQEDGSLAETAYEFTTDTSGCISVKGLDAGTYTIAETAAASGHMAFTTPLTLTITPTYQEGALSELGASLSGGNGDTNTKVVTTAADTGTVTIQATNARWDSSLPLTGLPGITLVYVAGGTILAVSVVALVRRHKKGQA